MVRSYPIPESEFASRRIEVAKQMSSLKDFAEYLIVSSYKELEEPRSSTTTITSISRD